MVTALEFQSCSPEGGGLFAMLLKVMAIQKRIRLKRTRRFRKGRNKDALIARVEFRILPFSIKVRVVQFAFNQATRVRHLQ
jgi:hypothetical protein